MTTTTTVNKLKSDSLLAAEDFKLNLTTKMTLNICGVHLASENQTKRNSKGKAKSTKRTTCNIVNCVLPRSLT